MPGDQVGHVLGGGQGPARCHVPQGLVEWDQLRGEVQGGQDAGGRGQPALVLAGDGGLGALQQGVGLHGGVQERVGLLRGEEEGDVREGKGGRENQALCGFGNVIRRVNSAQEVGKLLLLNVPGTNHKL